MLDLRHNGGGLLNEAVTVASVFLQDGRVVSTKGRARPEQRLQRRGRRDLVARSRSSCSSTRAPPRPRRSSPARCRTASARRSSARAPTARASSRRSSRCANGGALDITVGEYFTPTGRNLGGGGVRKGAGITPDIKASDDPETRRTRRCDKALETVAGREFDAFVGVLDKRGRILRGHAVLRARPAASTSRSRAGERVGDLVAGRAGEGPSARGSSGGSGSPDVARDVLEALMLAPRAAAALRSAGRARGAARAEVTAGLRPPRSSAT